MSNQELNLTVPERKGKGGRGTRLVIVLLVCVLIVGIVNLVFAVLGSPDTEKDAGASAALPPEQQKELALKFEKQGLAEQAARAWREYLQTAALSDKERGNIMYRIGKVYHEEGVWDKALDAYYRAETYGLDSELRPEIGRRIAECLESLGKFAALRYELAERVGMDTDEEDTGEEVLAEIGPQKITKAELDRRIEAELDRQLGQLAGRLSPEQRKAQKERILQSLDSPQNRLDMLRQIVAEEVLYRKAREMELAERPEVRDMLRDAERKLLAQRVIEEEVGGSVNITPTDLETYYKAHKDKYTEPPQAKISHILVDSKDKAEEVLERLEKGESFEKLAGEMSMDEATRDAGGAIEQWVSKAGAHIPGIGESEEGKRLIFATDAGDVVREPVETGAGYHVIMVRERKPARQLPFEDVRNDAYRTLAAQKEREVQESLLATLRNEYDVVIHYSRFEQEKEDDSAGASQDIIVTPPAQDDSDEDNTQKQ